jgi:prevent-host-death family protein
MTHIISVGELRQNPARMLRDVKAGATYVVTDHGEPVAEIAPRREPRWVSAAAIDALLRELGEDEAWARDLAADRAAVNMTSPWNEAS